MPCLIIQCRYIAHSYSGVRKDRDQRDELDWPPAPARLHQALIGATLANLPDSLRSAYSEKTLDALRWLETLQAPDIIASKLAADGDYQRALQVAMPHNSPAKGDFSRYHPDLAPVYRAIPEHDGSLLLAYRWLDDTAEVCRKAELHLAALKEAAAKLRYLGRAEDRVECKVVWRRDEKDGAIGESLEIWRPVANAADLRLLTARPNSTTELIQEFANLRIQRGAKQPVRLFLREQNYSRDAAEGLLPTHVAIFQIFRDSNNPDELPVVCDAVNAHRWGSPLRELACKIAKEGYRWSDPVLAGELISGHDPNGGRTLQPHLAFVPLPSISCHGKADGRVRRYALFGNADDDTAPRAASIYRTLAACLDGEEIEPGFRLQFIGDPLHRDKVWRIYAGLSQVWLSVTPVAIDRGYNVPTYSPDGQLLSSNERHLRRQAEWTSLLRVSLRHIRLPDDLVATCKITLTPSPLREAIERGTI